MCFVVEVEGLGFLEPHSTTCCRGFVLELVGLIERLLDGLEGELRASADARRCESEVQVRD